MFARSFRLALAALTVGAPLAASAQTYNLAAAFNTFNAPGSPFQAGFALPATPGSFVPFDPATFVQYDVRTVQTFNNGQTLDTFTSSTQTGAPYTPGVFLSGPTGVNDPTYTPKYGPNQLALHPGAQGQYSVIRFTAPTTNTYQFSFSFFGLDGSGPFGGTTSDANIVVDGFFFLAGGDINGNDPANALTTAGTVGLSAGDYVDFAVGWGSNMDYTYDTTALTGSISAVPEPGTVALVGAGVLALGGVARRRRRAV